MQESCQVAKCSANGAPLTAGGPLSSELECPGTMPLTRAQLTFPFTDSHSRTFLTPQASRHALQKQDLGLSLLSTGPDTELALPSRLPSREQQDRSGQGVGVEWGGSCLWNNRTWAGRAQDRGLCPGSA